MREKHFTFSIFVITVTIAFLLGFFMLTTKQAIAANGYKGNYKHKEWQKERGKEYQKHQQEMERGNRKHYKGMSHRSYDKRSDYPRHRGYRERPYDHRRHYGQYNFKGHRYDYHGHWRSWDQWDRYRKKHPHIYKHGRYYRENAHLMFRFCEPGLSNCFFFSIGK
jgi:hypothetical protein